MLCFHNSKAIKIQGFLGSTLCKTSIAFGSSRRGCCYNDIYLKDLEYIFTVGIDIIVSILILLIYTTIQTGTPEYITVEIEDLSHKRLVWTATTPRGRKNSQFSVLKFILITRAKI